MSTPSQSRPIATVERYAGNIFIYQTSRAYRREVEAVLRLILTTQAGRILIQHIQAANRTLLIIPYRPTKDDPVNAYASANDFEASLPLGHAHVWTYDYEVPFFGKIKLVNVAVGTGVGSPVTIKFHPATFHQYAKTHGYIPPGSGAGEILFHEMVHALQQMKGMLLRDAVAENKHMDNFTEFCAVVAANIYRSERGFTMLRANHRNFTRLGKYDAIKSAAKDSTVDLTNDGADLTDPATFASVYASSMRKWVTLQPDFCRELARSTARFNPLKFAIGA